MLPRNSKYPHRAPRLACALLTSCIALCGPALSQTPKPPEAGEQLQTLVHAEQLALEANDPAQILVSARQLGAVALQLLGTLYAGQGKCALASDNYRHSLAALGDTPNQQARLLTELSLLTSELCADHAEQAGQVARDITALAGNTAQVHMLLANAHETAGDLAGTVAALKEAVALDPNSGLAHLALGNAYWELNEFQYNADTLREFTIAQHQLPDNFNANQDLGAVLSQYERYDDALPYLQKAAAEDPHSPTPWLQMGMNAFAQGHPENASAALKKAVALTGSDESQNRYQIRRAYAALSRLASESGNSAEADQYAQREAKTHAAMRATDASRPLSESMGSGPMETATATGGDRKHPNANPQPNTNDQLVRQLNEIAAKSLNDAGTVLARGHDYAAALPLFQIASTADPDLQPIMRNLGLAAFHTRDWKTAIDALPHALEQHPDDALAQNDLAQARAERAAQAAPH